ncbi:hypothetical protein EV361DRAFT_873727 [Lentinula raphanica]|nr:hypothetical protein EV361DRAFT_873727 [Lentinula raphanica]
MAVPAYDFVEAVLSSLVDQGIRGHKAKELLVHTLLHILKDLPVDLPEDVDGIIKVLKEVLKIGSSNISFHLDAATQPQTRNHANMMESLLALWDTGMQQPEREVIQRHNLMMSIFCSALKASPRIDLIFALVAIYTCNLKIDMVRTTHFLYQHVALSSDTIFQRNLLPRFLTWFETSTCSLSHKAYFIRYIVSPMLLVQLNKTPSSSIFWTPHSSISEKMFLALKSSETPPQSLETPEILKALQNLWSTSKISGLLGGVFRVFGAEVFFLMDGPHSLIWRRILEGNPFTETDDMFKIELLHLTTILVQHFPSLVSHLPKDILKCTWHFVGSSNDPIVKETAFLLNARFFVVFGMCFFLRALDMFFSRGDGNFSNARKALKTCLCGVGASGN